MDRREEGVQRGRRAEEAALGSTQNVLLAGALVPLLLRRAVTDTAAMKRTRC